MKLDDNKKALRKKLYLFSTIALAAIYTLNGLVISPIYIGVINNIMYDGSALVDILFYLRRLLELAAVAAAYAVMIYGIYRFTLSGFRGGVGIFIGATLYKYATNVVVDWVNNGSIPTTWLVDILYILFYTTLELLQLSLVLAIVCALISRHEKAVEFCKKVGKTHLIPEIFPFKKLYDKENCLLRSVLACSIVILLINLITQAINDILTIEKILDPLLMIVAYLAEIVLAVICYFVMYVTINICADKLDIPCDIRENA
ncbi:MAG: hypothetical protein E7592_00865 [Ruminococcaceae bacterium]|nr:hypothetical protein [Oscillospiraceae bacterium]